MKKIFTTSISLILPFNRTFSLLQPRKLVRVNHTTYDFSKTLTSQNGINEAELTITNISETKEIKKNLFGIQIDQTNEITSRTSSEDDESDLRDEISKIRGPGKRINFKINAKSLLKNYPTAKELFASIERIQFSEHVLLEMIQANPEITTLNPSAVSHNISQLMKLGFNPHEIKKIVRSYPLILEYEGWDIFDTFEAWRSGGLFERFLINLFTNYPYLFSLDNAEVTARLKRIKYLMMNKINRVTAFVERNPAVMNGDWNKIEEKFKYLYEEMRITEKDMSYSSAFSVSLSFIKLRHSFVERCGIYIRPKKKEVRGFGISENPSLSAIIDTPDDIFAINVAKVSPEEYEVFKKLMKFEDSDAVECDFDEKVKNIK